MRYAVARYNQFQRDTAYRIYVTDILRISSTALGAEISKSWAQIAGFDDGVDDDRPPEEIVQSVIDKLGLEVVRN